MEDNISQSNNPDHTDNSSVPLHHDEDDAKLNDVKIESGKDDANGKEQHEARTGFQSKGLVYGVDDRPPFNITLISAF